LKRIFTDSKNVKTMDEFFIFILIVIGSILLLSLLLLINYFFAKEFALAAKDKGYENKKYFWIAFVFGIVGYLLVAALPDRKNVKKEKIDELPEL